ncbi:hypothetical protein RS030_71125 [Cryptosporidium xiaoi]|uniref:Cleavage/polyadenylation specificity factor A subunit C-terminal domain-containing protein n=1 Tax=Cryptosporidium xiaoi TaxID=659607 RepID=A0AAV9XTE8_9CRYT
MLLNKEFRLGYNIEKVVTGRFFPCNKSKNSDILLLNSGEIYLYNGEYVLKDGLLGSDDYIDTLNTCDEAFLKFKLDYNCIGLWKYSIIESDVDFIILIDSSYRLVLLSVKKISVPHCNNCHSCKIGNTDNPFNTNELLFTERFVIKIDSTINLLETYTCNLNISNKYSENTSVNSDNIIFSFDYFTGFIVISLNMYNIIFISPKIMFSGKEYIESIELKLCSRNLIYINQSEYKLSDLVLIGDKLKSKTLLFLLLKKLDTFVPHFQIIIPDWHGTLSNNKILNDNPSYFFIQDNNIKPIMKSIKFELENPNLTIGRSEFSLSNQFSIHGNNKSQLCNNSLHVFHMQSHANNQPVLGEYGHEKYLNKKLILIYDYSYNQIIIIFGNLFPKIDELNGVENGFKNKLYKGIYENSGFKLEERLECESGYEYKEGELEIKYVQINMNLSCGNRILLVDYFYESNNELLKALLLFDNSIVLELSVYFKDDKIVKTEIRDFNSIKMTDDFPDIIAINKCSINDHRLNREYLISSSLGGIKRIKLQEQEQDINDISVSNKNELVDIKNSIIMDDNKVVLVAKKKKWTMLELNDSKYGWMDYTLLKIFEMNSVKIKYLHNFNIKKQGIGNIISFALSENSFLLFYIKPIGYCEIDFIIKCNNTTNYYAKNITDLNISCDNTSSMLITLDVLSIGNNMYLSVTNKGIILSEMLFLTKKEDQNCDYMDNSLSTRSKYIWRIDEFFDELMFVSAIDELTLMLITQEMDVIRLKINLEGMVEVINIMDVRFINIITCFDSKLVLFNSEYGTLSLIGSSENNVYCIFISNGEKKYKVLRLGNNNYCNPLVTSIKIGKKMDNNIYIINNEGNTYIYDINKVLVYIFEETSIEAKKVMYINDFVNLNCESLKFDWKILSNVSEIIETSGIRRINIIICSTLCNIFMEVLEYLDVILYANMKKISVPEFSIYSPIVNNANNNGFYINGITKILHFVNLNMHRSNNYEKNVELDYGLEEFDKMIYLKESKVILLNTIKKTLFELDNNTKNSEDNEYISKLILLNTNGSLIGKINYYCNCKLASELPYKIFPFDGKSGFFQTTINKYKNTVYTRINLLFIHYDNNSEINNGNIMIKYGDCILNYLRVDFIIKHPTFKIFVFISKITFREKTSNNNKFLISLYKLETKNNPGENIDKLVFSSELELVKMSDIEIFDVISVKSAEFIEYDGYNEINNHGILRLGINNNNANKNLIYVNLHINKKDQDCYTFSGKKNTVYNINFNNLKFINKKTVARKLSSKVLIKKRDSFSFIVSLNVGIESKLFIYGISIITNYLYRKNVDMSLFSSNVISLLFKLFDIIIINTKQTNKDQISNKRKSSNNNEQNEYNNGNKVRRKQSSISNFRKENNTSNQSILTLLGNNENNKFINFDLSEIVKSIDNVCINDCFISLYINSCNRCFKWRLFMITVIWWNIIYFNNDCNLKFKNESKIKRLMCPLIPNWFFEVPDSISTTYNNISGKSYIYSNMFKKEVVKEFYNASIIAGSILLDLSF